MRVERSCRIQWCVAAMKVRVSCVTGDTRWMVGPRISGMESEERGEAERNIPVQAHVGEIKARISRISKGVPRWFPTIRASDQIKVRQGEERGRCDGFLQLLDAAHHLAQNTSLSKAA